MDKNSDYDVVIVGAGIVGSLLAYALLKRSPTLRVVLVDENPQPNSVSKNFTHPGFDARSIALSAGTCDILDDLGFWAAIKDHAQPIEDIHISDRGCFGALDLCSEDKHRAFGYVLELHQIGSALNKQLDKLKQLTRFYGTRITNIEKQSPQTLCHLVDNTILTAKLCVAADGVDSLTRDLLSIPAQSFDYQCSAIIANVRCSKPHLNKAFERFTEFGPIALLPLAGNHYALVWSVASDDLSRLCALNDEHFLAELQHAFGYRAGVFSAAGKRDSYPLKLLKTAQPFTHRGVCIGNAAHCLHPVMGQGFNLGMRDLFVLAAIIGDLPDPQKIGGFEMLNRYWSARQADHNTTIGLTDSVVRVFNNNHWPMILGRNIALQAMRYLPDLSAPIIKQAKGQFPLLSRDTSE
ncbi:MAG: 2-octaprenyl-6-methoxyphenol hydroxylase [Psychromonas sp.]|jgi:2-octaprenyl-6-methoxyphenol hydroxylase|uniref:2-octaprenyl-6-methoxyphenyl hydroxylase n=1 Tax=Psychromonas sp. TaxID=1884585 RepID=UPI0039E6DB68